ncbi:YhcN/YlaJ family sporulation lipoprotein [Oceanobacillus halophilus]|uniref:Sporulation protein n=1 Tax=Oceanobacillus halophilus TaxID=930130 RepID=A0A494ZTS9_9BACI|nr:YhcN/YlaJ family sporulation lipoprotein [Oceanobacillus halophilus]RKQ29606.1 hypothetical protein D8M06_17595 [Oceanobacillus halophilus]
MKTIIITMITLSSFFIMSACNTDTDNTMQERDKVAEELNPNNEREATDNQDLNQQLGYVKYSKNDLDENMEQEAKIDRPEMAEMITRTILRNDGFEEVATLVTDQEVLIAYEESDKNETGRTAEIAKKTAESMMPSFYEIYVSKNSTLMQDIQSLHNSTTNRNYDNLIEQLIKEMKKSPQGKDDNV